MVARTRRIVTLRVCTLPVLLHVAFPRFNSGITPYKKIQVWLSVTFLGAFAELRKATIDCVMSVRLSAFAYGTPRSPLDRFSRNFILGVFTEIY